MTACFSVCLTFCLLASCCASISLALPSVSKSNITTFGENVREKDILAQQWLQLLKLVKFGYMYLKLVKCGYIYLPLVTFTLNWLYWLRLLKITLVIFTLNWLTFGILLKIAQQWLHLLKFCYISLNSLTFVTFI